MNIDRHNYETFFILYLDNELCPEDRRQVEDFILQHPDLKEELDLLMQFKLPEEAIGFPDKEELYKGSTLIHSGNQTEWLMLYMDGEVSGKEKLTVEAWLRDEAAARKELDLLMKTRLPEEAIVFNNKEQLYRREEEKRRVFPLFRLAAAILIAAIGIGIFFLLNSGKQEPVKNGAMASNKSNEKKGPAVSTDKEETSILPVITGVEGINEQPTDKKIIEAPTTPAEKTASVRTANVEKQTLISRDPVALNREPEPKLSNNLPVPVYDPSLKKEEKAIAYEKPETDIRNNEKNITVPEVTNPAVAPSDIRTASFDPNETLDDENGGGKKNRHRGLFRTIARTFEKRTKVDPTEDNKLLVAGFRISLK